MHRFLVLGPSGCASRVRKRQREGASGSIDDTVMLHLGDYFL